MFVYQNSIKKQNSLPNYSWKGTILFHTNLSKQNRWIDWHTSAYLYGCRKMQDAFHDSPI